MSNVVRAEQLPANMEEMHGKMDRLEEAMRQAGEIELPVKHFFAHGVYGRQLFIPKGTVLTGKIHKYDNLNVMIQGELSVLTKEGVKRVKAPFTIVSPAGTRRVAYAHEDTIWMTVHGTFEQDLEKIEEYFIAQSYSEYLEFCKEQLCLGQQ